MAQKSVFESFPKQEEQKKAVKQYEFQIKQAENEAIRIKGNEERETLKYHAQINKEKSDYDHRLAIQRDQAKMEVEQQTQEKILRFVGSNLVNFCKNLLIFMTKF